MTSVVIMFDALEIPVYERNAPSVNHKRLEGLGE